MAVMMDVDNIIEMHDSWLAVNSIVGCTNGCKYCFLQATNDNLARPRVKATAKDAIKCLFMSKFYDPKIPICLLPNTDPFLNSTNISYTKECLSLLEQHHVSNPVVLITKCLIPEDFVNYLSELDKKGLKIIIYLSLSGLGKEYEPNINVTDIELNFRNLRTRGIRVIHYYRPFIPENSSSDSIKKVLDFVNDYTDVSLICGLKVREDFIDNLKFWDVTTTKRKACLDSLSVWPKSAYDYFFQDYTHPQNVFQINVCALAQVLKQPCTQFYGTLECKKYNHCSEEQRSRCALAKQNMNKNIGKELFKLLNKLGKFNDKIVIEQKDSEIILKNVDLTVGELSYLTYLLGYKISIPKKSENDNYFNSALSNAKPLIVK